jgi:hypothetical protein
MLGSVLLPSSDISISRAGFRRHLVPGTRRHLVPGTRRPEDTASYNRISEIGP